MDTFDFGVLVKDNITGFTGRITARAEYITGCVQYCVTPTVDKDGKVQDAHWLDEDRLTDCETETQVVSKATGGPQDAPTKANAHP